MGMDHFVSAHPEAVDAVRGLQDRLQRSVDKYRGSIKRMLGKYGFVYGSVRSGGSPTGPGWTYPDRGHLAATAWAGMMLLHRPEDAGAVDEASNPYAVPPTPVPAIHSGGDMKCMENR